MRLHLKRHIRHWLARDRRQVLNDAALQRLTQRVAQSEQHHGGEIRICIEARLPDSYLARPQEMRQIVRQRALSQFAKMRVWDTERNNGVLIYLLLAERAIEIVADRGIAKLVPEDRWQSTVQALAAQLRSGQFEAGLNSAVDEISELLTLHFPRQAGDSDTNELADEPRVI